MIVRAQQMIKEDKEWVDADVQQEGQTRLREVGDLDKAERRGYESLL